MFSEGSVENVLFWYGRTEKRTPRVAEKLPFVELRKEFIGERRCPVTLSRATNDRGSLDKLKRPKIEMILLLKKLREDNDADVSCLRRHRRGVKPPPPLTCFFAFRSFARRVLTLRKYSV